MSTRDDYTREEWFLLANTPGMIGAGVMMAAGSGPFGTLQEAFAFARGVVATTRDPGEVELIRSLVERRDGEQDQELIEDFKRMAMEKRDRLAGNDHQALRAEAVADARAVSELLARKATPEEAAAYKRWLLDLGRRVSEAAKEGSILGFGGERVSDEEQAMLDEVARALEGA